MTRTTSVLLALVCFAAAACASTSTSFVSTWKSPSAQPLQLRGAKVVAVAMIQDPTSRKAAEDRLAKEITAHGAEGVSMYAIMPEATVGDEAKVKAALEQANVQGIVVIHPTGSVSQGYEASSQPMYDAYWDGYYAHGWAAPWDGADTVTNAKTVVSVDTRIYSLKQNKLVWAGQSKTTNPASVDALVAELSTATADQLSKLGLIAK
jgi:hypothetical protein